MNKPKIKIIPHKLTDKKLAQVMEDYINYIYGEDLLNVTLKDPTKYRGKGRPRKSDYSPLIVIQRKNNILMNKYLDHIAKERTT